LNDLAVCSWSLRPRSPAHLAELVRDCSLRAVQLHLDPIRLAGWREDETRRALADAGIEIISGMMAPAGEDYTTLDSIRRTGGVRPDETWETNLRAAHDNAEIARRLGISLVTLHAGHIAAEPGSAERMKMIDRLHKVVDAFASRAVRVAFETGQDPPDVVVGVLAQLNRNRPASLHVGVNFDPANMILYGTGEPMAALRIFLPHILQAHAKDALPAGTPGAWGTEMPLGEGAVDWSAFTRMITRRAVRIVIERESGENRVEDVRKAVRILSPMLSRDMANADG
jgi:L-ribulose-5-phosphate 3-epimerase